MRSAFVFAILFSVYLHVSADTELLRPKRARRGATRCKKVVDIALVIDESGSITLRNFRLIKRFLQKTVARFSVRKYGAHFGIVKYSTRAKLVFPLNRYTNKRKLISAINKIRYRGGSTYTGKALYLARLKFFGRRARGNRKNVPDVLVLFSDGASHDHKRAVKQAKILKRRGVKILVVAIGKGLTVKKLSAQLGQLASNKKYVFKTAMAALDTIRDDLVKEMCEAAGCATARYIKQGCFATPQPKLPGTATLLFSKRDNIEWSNKWDEFIDDLVCKCGTAARRKRYKYFFIEFYGECWGSNTRSIVTGRQAGPKKCWGKRPNYAKCNRREKLPICVGTEAHGYVYRLKGRRRFG